MNRLERPLVAETLDPRAAEDCRDAARREVFLSASVPFVLSATFRNIECHPQRAAVSWGGRTITYAELGFSCAAIEDALLRAGVERGSLLAFLFQDHWLMVPAMLAAATMGCPFVPLDPGIPILRLRAMIEAVPVSTIVCDAGVDASALGAGSTPIFLIDHAMATASAAAKRPVSRESSALDPDEFAAVYFTSGSTGRPKAIAGRLRGVDAFVQWEIATLGLGAGCRVSQLALPSFDAFLKDVFVPLCAGGTVCVPQDPDLPLRPGDLAAWLAQERVEVLHLVPSLFRQLFKEPLPNHGLPALKAIVLAGEPVRPSDVRRSRALFGDRVTMLNLYGPTETTLTRLCHIVGPEDATAALVPIGKPMPGTHVCLVDESGRLCEPGAVGEIFITTAYRSLGYLGQPELTAAKFVADPEGSPDLAYRTGDLARLNANGEYEYIGRADNQVKIRGVRIELEEIEAMFATHDAITEVAAIARQDPRGDMELACYCVVKSAVSANTLRDYAAARLPRLMLPSVIRLVSSLPHTANGKLDRRALAQNEPPEIIAAPTSAALTDTERMLTALFKDVLHVNDVDPTASFFVLGGQSLLAINLLARIDEALSIELSLGELFKHSSVAALASVIDARMEVSHA